MVTPEVVLIRLSVAVLLGAIVGLERERVESAAGLRTHALVCLGSALAMLVSSFGFSDAVQPPNAILDPSRVAAQVVSGIGFLGAGVIIFRKEIIRGLTTAASVWVVAGIGLAVGGGMFVAACGATALSLAILAVMKPLERRLSATRRLQSVTLILDPRLVSVSQVKAQLIALGIPIETFAARLSEDPEKNRVDLTFRRMNGDRVLEVLEALAQGAGIREVRSAVDMRQRRATGIR
jgi:putative Mg2+ transporter-C (MgtC) family protein